jgi:organic radical activating enzyme
VANIAITTGCSRSCDFCFAPKSAEHGATPPSLMSRATFVGALDFVDRSGVNEVRLLGGEPTLHPHFVEFLSLALERGKPVRVFTNGTMSEPILEFVEKLDETRVIFLVNISSVTTADDAETLARVLQRLGPRSMLAVTVRRSRPNLVAPFVSRQEDLFDTIDRYRLRRAIRLGIAHPRVGSLNAFLPPSQYTSAARSMAALVEQATARNVAVSLDCGIGPCIAREVFRRGAWEDSQASVGQCNPVLDICPDGTVVPCFPLATLCSRRLDATATASAVRAEFEDALRVYRGVGVGKACAACQFKRSGRCFGGCLGAAMTRLRIPEFRICVPSTPGLPQRRPGASSNPNASSSASERAATLPARTVTSGPDLHGRRQPSKRPPSWPPSALRPIVSPNRAVAIVGRSSSAFRASGSPF